MKFGHYLKVSLRGLLKYKQQTAISVVGLAVGFVCFALSAYWIRYEWGYDSFQPNRDYIFRVELVDTTSELGYSQITPPPLAGYLKKHLPEVEAASRFRFYSLSQGEGKYLRGLIVDSGFFQVMHLDVLSGQVQDIFVDRRGVILSEKTALQFLGRTDAAGEEVSFDAGKTKFRVNAVVKDWPEHTNFPFSFLQFSWDEDDHNTQLWNVLYCNTYIRMRNGTELNQAVDKVENLRIPEWENQRQLKTIPLSELHRSNLNGDLNVKYKHILIFAAMGALVILCSLVNFIVLYVSRLRMRGKELLLRKVNGASNRDIMIQLFTEICMILCGAFVLGFIGLEWVLPRFKEMALIKAEPGDVFAEVIVYFVLIVLVLSFLAYLPVSYYRRKTYMQYIQSVTEPGNKNLFRYASLFLQLVIALGFMFCMLVFMKQIYHLTRGDIGFDRHNVCTLSCYGMNEKADPLSIMSEISALSSVEQVTIGTTLLPSFSSSTWWCQKEENSETSASLRIMNVLPSYLKLLGLRSIASSTLSASDLSDNHFILNETAVAQLGLNYPEENTFYGSGGICTVIGVVKDFYFESPLLPVCPIAFRSEKNVTNEGSILFKFREGHRAEAEAGVAGILKKQGIQEYNFKIYSMDETYDEFFKSERVLLVLLSILSSVCVLICIFGVYSMVSLTSEQRRKEMAIRKANGASVPAILVLFLKEYMSITLISACVAFLIGFLIMESWLESYVNRTTIDFWIYLLIWMVVSAIVLITVLIRVWKVAHLQPALELKKE